MAANKLKALTLKNSTGATITIPADQLALYSTIKSDQLTVLSGIVASHTAGFNVDFDENMISTLAGLVEELAHTCNEIMCVFSSALYVPSGVAKEEKGGE